MGKWDGLNRRKFPRANYPCLIVINRGASKSDQTILAHTENIGQGGICLILKNPLKLFAEVDLEMDLMDLESHIKCKGKVVWSVRRKLEENKKPLAYDIGIEFGDLNKKERERISSIINRMAQNKKEISLN